MAHGLNPNQVCLSGRSAWRPWSKTAPALRALGFLPAEEPAALRLRRRLPAKHKHVRARCRCQVWSPSGCLCHCVESKRSVRVFLLRGTQSSAFDPWEEPASAAHPSEACVPSPSPSALFFSPTARGCPKGLEPSHCHMLLEQACCQVFCPNFAVPSIICSGTDGVV